jgi:hypothetical protein
MKKTKSKKVDNVRLYELNVLKSLADAIETVREMPASK